MKDNEIIEGYWWCKRCQSTKSPCQVTYEESCTVCGSHVEWREESEAPMSDSQKPTQQPFRDAVQVIEKQQAEIERLQGEIKAWHGIKADRDERIAERDELQEIVDDYDLTLDSAHGINFLVEQNRIAFQLQGTYDGAMSEACKQQFADQYAATFSIKERITKRIAGRVREATEAGGDDE